jgi:hypothetical protein
LQAVVHPAAATTADADDEEEEEGGRRRRRRRRRRRSTLAVASTPPLSPRGWGATGMSVRADGWLLLLLPCYARTQGERLVARVRRRAFGALLRKDVAYFDRRRSGDALSKISADTVVLSKAFFECSAAARSGLSVIGGVGLLLWISPPLVR